MHTCDTKAGRAAAYSTELAGQAAAEADIAGRRPEHLVFTLGSKHIKALGIRIGWRHRLPAYEFLRTASECRPGKAMPQPKG